MNDDNAESEYARMMIEHHRDAIRMSRALLAGKPRPRIRAFAEGVVSEQSKEISWLKSWLAKNSKG